MRFGNDILRQADALAAYTEDPPRLTRTYLTSQHRQAGNFLLGLMREAAWKRRTTRSATSSAATAPRIPRRRS
jgi:hypothetical protein